MADIDAPAPITFKVLPALAWYLRRHGMSLAAELVEHPQRDPELVSRLERIPQQFAMENADRAVIADALDLLKRGFRREEHGQTEYHSIWETRMAKLQPAIRAWVMALEPASDRPWVQSVEGPARHTVYTCVSRGIEVELGSASRGKFSALYSFKGHRLNTSANVDSASRDSKTAWDFAQRAALVQLEDVMRYAGVETGTQSPQAGQ